MISQLNGRPAVRASGSVTALWPAWYAMSPRYLPSTQLKAM